MMSFLFLFLAAITVESVTPTCNPSTLLPDASVADAHYCPFVWNEGVVASPRGIVVASNNDLLVVDSANEQVVVLWDGNSDGKSASGENAVLATQAGITHGLAIGGGKLYASTATDVYRWSYTPGQRGSLSGYQHVIANVPYSSDHITRTLRTSPTSSWLYVHSGSGSNVDSDPTHAQIRRFKISTLSSTPLDWNTAGVIVATGMRNEVGFDFDEAGDLWGVENGVDGLNRPDLGGGPSGEDGPMHGDNPCEELNYIPTGHDMGQFYGYPYCFSEGLLPSPPGEGPGAQWLHPRFSGDPFYTDAWCKDPDNVVPPAYCMGAHLAPLDIVFGNLLTSLPSGVQRRAYVTTHGSWNRPVRVGADVRIMTWYTNGTITDSILLSHAGSDAWVNGWIRPVGADFMTTTFGKSLMVSSDYTGQIIGLAYVP